MAEEVVEEGGFRPQLHMMKVPGGRSYLPVAARVLWFREGDGERPAHSIDEGWGVVTEMLEHKFDEYAMFKAQIIDPQGRVVGEGTNMETKRGFPDYQQKAETGAIGRAFAACGYGTMSVDMDEGEVVDSPIAVSGEVPCEKCRKPVPAPRAKVRQKNGKPILCFDCDR
jgi:hypothetical protein